MGEKCKLQCERKCQVWQLAVGGDLNPNPHLHMPCLPGGGKPGGGLTLRTYEGGCRSACSGSVRHPVQHMYPAGRMKKWFFDSKEWFWDGIFVMKTENPTKSASHFCLPYPRPTMRLPRSCNSRLVEVHHVHPPPTTGAAPDESDDGTFLPQNSVKSTTPQTPLQEGSEPRLEAGSDVFSMDSLRSNLTEPQASGAEKPSATPALVHQPRETDAENRTMPNSGKIESGTVRISCISVEAGPPQRVNPGEPQFEGGMKYKESTDRKSELTYVNYSTSSFCPRFCLQRCCQGTNVDAVATTAVDVKELDNCYVFVADIPGLKHTEIKVQVENDSVLKVSGDRTRDDYAMDTEFKYVRVERNPGRVMRKFSLPADTNLDGISAACQDGLLTVIVPKNPQADPCRPRSFDVDVHSASSLSPPVTASNST